MALELKKIDYDPLYRRVNESSLADCIPVFRKLVETHLYNSNNGHLEMWAEALDSFPVCQNKSCNLLDEVRFDWNGKTTDLEDLLKVFHPWRKGPIRLGSIVMDTEWRSDWKWDRLKNHIAPLTGRTVLDVGCGNGYYLWRMVGAGVGLAIGIDPFLLYVMQFWAIKQFAPDDLAVWVVPAGWEDLPEQLAHFDSVFAMGVLYHQRDPNTFLKRIQNYLRPGGELVLETLVIPGETEDILIPNGRYAKMRNVWYIPTVRALEQALKIAGWKNVRCIDVSVTSTEEQRSTPWMTFESLADFLDPKDPSKTIEGYPAPRRAIVLANKAG